MESARTQAILLLTAHFSKAADTSVKPLSNKEWGTFALWLHERRMDPEKLLTGDLASTLEGWTDQKITLPRLEQLLQRGTALALAMEKWERSGLWVITRSDSDYPKRLKEKLGHSAPPVLFGCGNRAILNRGGIGVVGSRNASADNLKYSTHLGALAAATGLSVVSGGARGIDEAAMLGTLEAEGMAIGVMANELLSSATSSKYRRHLMQSNLALVSPFHPEAGFNAGNAMQRNKYIYCLSDAAIVVHSGTKGGTWDGALENLRHQWVPLWIKPTDDPDAGNSVLVNKGGQWLPGTIPEIDLNTLLAAPKLSDSKATADIFDAPTKEKSAPASMEEHPSAISEPQPGNAKVLLYTPAQEDAPASAARLEKSIQRMSLYEHFLLLIASVASTEPQTVEQLLALTGLQKSQLNAWLKDAIEEGKMDKLSRPIRYQWITAQQQKIFKD